MLAIFLRETHTQELTLHCCITMKSSVFLLFPTQIAILAPWPLICTTAPRTSVVKSFSYQEHYLHGCVCVWGGLRLCVELWLPYKQATLHKSARLMNSIVSIAFVSTRVILYY